MAGQRLTRINEEMKKEIAQIIRTEIKDPSVKDVMISVVDVDATNDLKQAKVYISVLQDNKKNDAINALTKASGFIRREVAHRVNLRNTPELIFKLDESIEKGIEMSKLIDTVMTKGNK